MLTPKEAAALLRISHKTLQDWRLDGKGPVFHKLGRVVRYDPNDLAAYLAGTARTNTGGGVPA
jgi:excisionase family DNA binding protein